MKTTEKKIEKLQKKVQNFKNKIEDEICEICENLKYKDENIPGLFAIYDEDTANALLAKYEFTKS